MRGADGYVLKDANSTELMLAIRTVAVGRQFLCKAIASKILSGYLSGHISGEQRASSPSATQSITEREREVLTRIALGKSNKLIARELGVSPKTVEKTPLQFDAQTAAAQRRRDHDVSRFATV